MRGCIVSCAAVALILAVAGTAGAGLIESDVVALQGPAAPDGTVAEDLPPGSGSFEVAATPIPEPATMGLLGAGLAALIVRRKRMI